MDSSILITLSIPVFFGLILIEFFYGIITKKNNYRINDAITSISLGLISRFVPILGLGFQYVVYKAIAEQYNLKLLNSENAWVWVTAFILYDVCFIISCYSTSEFFNNPPSTSPKRTPKHSQTIPDPFQQIRCFFMYFSLLHLRLLILVTLGVF